MIQNPIRKVLSTMRSSSVRFLLMGGQACVLYGAAEFSRDTDLIILATEDNLDNLSNALDQLDAQLIAIPDLSIDYLNRGHAVHFRCQHPDANGIWVDVMSVLRGVDSFNCLWERRTTIETGDGVVMDLLSLPDLVKAKKTQRDKDWPMLRRLVEAHAAQHHEHPNPKQVEFWLKEARTPELLIEAAGRFPEAAQQMMPKRLLLRAAINGNERQLQELLAEEERREREKDRNYWAPLREELERLRHTTK